MKKKLLVVKLIALCIALVLAMGLVLTACGEDSMIRPNKERTAKQAAAVVNYGGRQAYVDKTSVLTSFYNYYNTIYQYYQMGYISADQFTAIADNLQDTFDDANESLAKNALFKLYCIEYLEKQEGRVNSADTKGKTYDFTKISEQERYVADRIAELESLLNVKEKNEAIFNVNHSMDELLSDYIKEITEQRSEEVEEEEEKVDAPSVENMTSLVLTSAPRKVCYELGEALSLKGMVLTINYSKVFDDSAAVDAFFTENTRYTKGAVSEVTGGIRVAYSTTVDNFEDFGTVPDITGTKELGDLKVDITYGTKKVTFNVSIIEARPHRTQEAQLKGETEEHAHDHAHDHAHTFEDAVEYGADGKMLPLAKFSFDVVKKDEETAEEFSIRKEAMNRLEKYLSDNFSSYDYYYIKELETVLVNTCKDLSTRTYVTQADIEQAYKTQVEKDLNQYGTEAGWIEAVETSYSSSSVAYTLGDKGIYFIKHILFPFSTEQNKQITALSDEKGSTEDAIQAYREIFAKQIGVWLSNPDFDTTAVCDAHQCVDCKKFDIDADDDHVCDECGGEVEVVTEGFACDCPLCENYTGDEVYPNGGYAVCPLTDCDCKACPSNEYVDLAGNVQTSAINVLELVGADKNGLGGAIANAIDAIDRASFDSEVEYRQAVIDEFDKWIYMADGANSGMEDVLKSDSMGNVATPEDYDTKYVENFTNLARDLAKKGFGSYGWCVSEYGIHFIMITGYTADVVVETGLLDGEEAEFCAYLFGGYVKNTDGSFSKSANGGYAKVENGRVILPYNYVVDTNAFDVNDKTYITKEEYDRYVLTGEKTGLGVEGTGEDAKYYHDNENYKVTLTKAQAEALIASGEREVKGSEESGYYYYVAKGTLEFALFESIVTNKQNDLYSSFQKTFLDNNVEGNVEYFPEVYADSVKDIKEQMQG